MSSSVIGRRSFRRLIMEEINRSFPGCSTREIIIDSVPVVVEVADTPHLRNRGLMFRESIPENSGMLFSFPDNSQRSFWMKNTYSMGTAPYALEMNDGWFQRNGFRSGTQILNLPGRANQ